MFERIDLIYRLHIDQVYFNRFEKEHLFPDLKKSQLKIIYFIQNKRQVQLEQIHLPELISAGNYPIMSSYFKKVTNIGIFEDDHSLFFYQIDYFGQIFLKKYQWNGVAEQMVNWTKFKIEGDKFEVNF